MGYKRELFVKNVDENLFCAICHEVFSDPLSCKDGHTFCSDCIQNWLQTKKRCPLDNRAICLKKLVRNLAIKGIIDNLEVSCHIDETLSSRPTRAAKRSRLESGEEVRTGICDWKGKLQHLTMHKKTCPFKYVRCSFTNCSKMIQRREMKEHKKTCKYRTVLCKECNCEVIEHELVSHQGSTCPDALIPCPNNCHTNGALTTIRRIFMNQHLTEVCTEESVACIFTNQGCSENILRKDLDKHLRDNISSHMLLLINQNAQLNDELSKVKENLTKLKDREPTSGIYMWKINNFKSLANTKPQGRTFTSPVFSLCGHKWKLRLFPNGTKNVEKGTTSLFLVSIDAENGQITESGIPVLLRLAVLSHNSARTPDCSFSSNHTFTNRESDWGWSKFMKLSDAISPSYCSAIGVDSGRLYVQCTMHVCDDINQD